MKLSLFDTHCDTAYELYHRGVHLGANDGCHVSLDKAACYDRYAQYYAVWSNRRLDDETCWEHFLKIAANFKTELETIPDQAVQVTSAAELEAALRAEMEEAAEALAFEKAAELRDRIDKKIEIKKTLTGSHATITGI